jgi:hypothetical protein
MVYLIKDALRSLSKDHFLPEGSLALSEAMERAISAYAVWTKPTSRFPPSCCLASSSPRAWEVMIAARPGFDIPYVGACEGSLSLSSYLELRLAPATHTPPRASLPRSAPAASSSSLPAGVPSAKGWSLVGPATFLPKLSFRHNFIYALKSEEMIFVDPPSPEAPSPTPDEVTPSPLPSSSLFSVIGGAGSSSSGGAPSTSSGSVPLSPVASPSLEPPQSSRAFHPGSGSRSTTNLSVFELGPASRDRPVMIKVNAQPPFDEVISLLLAYLALPDGPWQLCSSEMLSRINAHFCLAQVRAQRLGSRQAWAMKLRETARWTPLCIQGGAPSLATWPA